jgi:hypothetical protein
MSVKVNLTGQPQGLRIEKDIATFKIVAGPASSTAPKGLPMFRAVTYVVQCSQKQYKKARASEQDKSELIIEGYQEPRVDESGKPYIAVVATSVLSKQTQNERKLTQIRDEVVKAEEAYEAACDQFGQASQPARAALELLEKVKANLLKFMSNHPELG